MGILALKMFCFINIVYFFKYLWNINGSVNEYV